MDPVPKDRQPMYRNPAMVVDEETQGQRDAEGIIKQWLNRYMRITLPDGRTLVGTAISIDGEGNLILQEAAERMVKKIKTASGEEQTVTKTHHHRSVIIPGKQIHKVEIEKAKPESAKPDPQQPQAESDEQSPSPTSPELD